MNTYVHRLRCAMIGTKAARAHCADRGRRSRGIARNETARKQNTSASAFQAKGDLRLECRYLRGLVSDGASASALHQMVGKVISQLPGFRIFAASLPSPPQLSTAGYRDPGQRQGGFVAPRCHLSPFASFHPASEAIRFRSW